MRRIAAILLMTAAAAQAGEFEVATVKQNKLDDRIVTVNLGPGGRFDARGYTLVLLMQRAYGVMDWNVTGGPGWIRTDRWDVSAKAGTPATLTEKQLQPLLQSLLAERFKLMLHFDSKETAGYALIVARSGPRVKRSADGEEHPDSFRLNATGLSGQGITMADFARYVGGKLGLVAVDQTGLAGAFDFQVKWPDVSGQSAAGFPGADPREAFRAAVFSAIEDQLGLKIVPRKIAIQMLVIDHVEKAAAEN